MAAGAPVIAAAIGFALTAIGMLAATVVLLLRIAFTTGATHKELTGVVQAVDSHGKRIDAHHDRLASHDTALALLGRVRRGTNPGARNTGGHHALALVPLTDSSDDEES